MNHAHIHLDEFAHLNTPLHKFDPRFKLVSFLILLVVIVNLHTIRGLLYAFVLLIFYSLSAHLPLSKILRRMSFTLPFLIALVIFLPFIYPGFSLFEINIGFMTLTFTKEGLMASLIFFIRLICGVLVVVIVTFTTPVNVLLRAITDLKVPAIFAQIIHFTLRYFFILYDEVLRMQRARYSRGYRLPRNLLSWSTVTSFGRLFGMLFIRAYERGERVYFAMLSRGYQGEIRLLEKHQVRLTDFFLALLVLLTGVLIVIIDKGSLRWLLI